MYVIYFFIAVIAVFAAAMLVIHFKNKGAVKADERESVNREKKVG